MYWMGEDLDRATHRVFSIFRCPAHGHWRFNITGEVLKVPAPGWFAAPSNPEPPNWLSKRQRDRQRMFGILAIGVLPVLVLAWLLTRNVVMVLAMLVAASLRVVFDHR